MRNKLMLALKDSAQMFAALGDETRLKLISSLLEQGPLSISKLVRVVPRGREKIWDLDGRRVQVAKDYLELISRNWDERIAALKAMVEN